MTCEPRSYALGPAPWPQADAWVLDIAQAPARLDAHPPTLLRLHAAGSTGFGHDLLQLQRSDIAGLLLPGVTGIAEICAVSERCMHPVLPVIDSAQALDQVRAIAHLPGVVRLVFDAAALQRDLGVDSEDALLMARAAVVLASRLARLARPVDDSRLGAQRARQLGFGARLCHNAADGADAHAAFTTTDKA